MEDEPVQFTQEVHAGPTVAEQDDVAEEKHVAPQKEEKAASESEEEEGDEHAGPTVASTATSERGVEAGEDTPTLITSSMDGENYISGIDQHQQLHLIDDNDQFAPGLHQWMEKNGSLNAGFDYGVVAVLGCQSSGKSTLLNILFGTHFHTMEAELGRFQVTKGIWLGLSKFSNTLVMDVEGTDGRERGEDTNFERKSSLFSLAAAQILLINMWMHDVGRWQSANYPLIRTVLELHLQLFQAAKKGKVKMLFVIRDHAFTPLEKLAGIVRQDMDKIWSQIAKTEQFETSKVTDFFDLDFVSLPPKPHQPEEFLAEAQRLSVRFNERNTPTSLWGERNVPEVPADGLPVYTENVWLTVRDNKDLDIPSQLEMLSTCRCDELAHAAYEEFAKAIATEKEILEVKGKFVENLGMHLNTAIQTALEHYDKDAKRYNPAIAEKKRDGLEENMANACESLYRAQLSILRDKAVASFKAEFSNALPLAPQPSENFLSAVKASRTSALNFFDEAATSSVPNRESCQWCHGKERDGVRSAIEEFITEKRVEHIERLLKKSDTDLQAQLVRPLTKLLENPNRDLWKNASEVVGKIQKEYKQQMKSALESSFSCTEEETVKHLQNLDAHVTEAVQKTIQGKTNMIGYEMERAFERVFRHDENGMPRRWTPADNVLSKFNEALVAAKDALDVLAIVRLDPKLRDVSILGEDAPDEGDYLILSRDEAKSMWSKFQKGVEGDYLRAQRDQEYASARNQLPWVWILLIMIFAFDEICYILGRPMLVLFVVFLGALGFIGYRLNLHTLILPVLDTVQRQVMENLGNVFQKYGDKGKKKAE